jgi:F0F1-type ATP synthase membrane subunit b/b'
MSWLRRFSQRVFPVFFTICLLALPVLAQEEKPNAADTPTGFVFRWIDFALVVAAIIWVIGKFGGPYFKATARAISEAIHGAAAGRVAAESELAEATRQLESVGVEIQELRRSANRESASEAERLRSLAKSESEKVARSAVAEIEAAERVARQQLRVIAARVATERAEALLKQRLNAASERALFGKFVGELEKASR